MTEDAPESKYIIDIESAAETARLMLQDRLITECMGGVLSELADVSAIHDILDLACGPGGWALDMAFDYPDKKVIGIDLSSTMVSYANAQAEAQVLGNVSFEVMNVLAPLQFPDASFDLVNARLLQGSIPKTSWPALLQECMRVTRPGGIIRLTDTEFGITNSPASEELSFMYTRALKAANLSFSPDGRHIGITPMLGWLLQEAGCQNIQQRSHVLDYSTGKKAHSGWYQNLEVGYHLIRDFFLATQVTTQEELEQVYQRMLNEMQAKDFCGVQYYLTVWGVR